MCTPTAYFVMTMATTAMQMKAAQDQGDFEEGTAKYNARVAENKAQETINVGVEEENIHREKTAQLLSQQKTQLGAAGVQLGGGSPLELQEQTERLGEVDALRIRKSYEGEAGSLMTQAKLTESQGEYAQTAAQNKSFGSLLSGASQMAGTAVNNKWYKPNSAANVGKIAPGQSFALTPR